MKTELEKTAKIAKRNTKISDSIEERKNYLLSLLDVDIQRSKIVICEVEKPCACASFSVKELKDRYRINYRCGYSRHNYAPCIEVLK